MKSMKATKAMKAMKGMKVQSVMKKPSNIRGVTPQRYYRNVIPLGSYYFLVCLALPAAGGLSFQA